MARSGSARSSARSRGSRPDKLYSVLQGTFLGANPALATSLDVLDSDRYGAGWLYAVEGAPDPGALDAGGYSAVLDATIDKMRDHL